MSHSKVIITLLVFSIQYIFYCIGAPCNTLTEPDCITAAPRCVWKQDNKCYCGSSAPLDVLFVMDESGSMKCTENCPYTYYCSNYCSTDCGYCNRNGQASYFDNERGFIRDMIKYGVSAESNIHVFKFGSSIHDVHNFWDRQDIKEGASDAVINRVMSTDHPGGSTKMSKALTEVQEVFNAWKQHVNYGAFEPLVVFLTDGNPSPSSYTPCPKVAATQAIIGQENMIVIIMGTNVNLNYIKCMVQPGYPNSGAPDYNRILQVDEWNQAAFDLARQAADKFLCPEVMNFKLTEVRMEQYTNANPVITYQSKFIELYNYGTSPIDLSQDTLKFTGFMTSASFGKATTSSACTITIQPKQYLVIYDNSLDAPECPNCNCTLSSTPQQCDEALYIPCDGSLGTNDCGICSWSSSQNNDIWDQQVLDYSGDGILSESERVSRAAWPKRVFPGYSSELEKDIGGYGSASDGNNWDMSCHYQGTPGAPPITNCTVSCITEICQGNGDTTAGCDTNKDVCDCTASHVNGNTYVLTTTQTSCIEMPPPSECQVINSIDPALQMDGQAPISQVDISWAGCSCYENGVKYRLSITPDGGETVQSESYATQTVKFSTETYVPMPDNTVVTVEAFKWDIVSEAYIYSSAAICNVSTMAPTQSPTPAPSYSNADIDECSATITNTENNMNNEYNILVVWSDAYKLHDSDINVNPIIDAYEYVVFGSLIPGTSSSSFTITGKTVTFHKFDKVTLDLPLNSPEISVVTVYNPYGSTELGGDHTTTSDGVRSCTIITQSPTPAPTNIPSLSPTKYPSQYPSQYPTQRPTYAKWILQTCSISITNTINTIAFTWDQQSVQHADTATIILYYGTKTQTFSVDKSMQKSINTWFQIAPADEPDLQTAIWNNNFEARIQYSPYLNAQLSEFITSDPPILCTFTTPNPTKKPTISPTKIPSETPTKIPSQSPTKYPSKYPTQSPTFKKLILTECNAKVSDGLIVEWTETIFNNNDIEKKTPHSNYIVYVIQINDDIELVSTFGAETSGALRNEPIDITGITRVERVSINIANGYGDSSQLPIICNIETKRPTSQPTTRQPTAYPLSQQPAVKFPLTIDNAASWGFDLGCSFDLEPPILCKMTRNTERKLFKIERTPIWFGYDINVHIQMEYLNPTGCSNSNNCDVLKYNDFHFSNSKTDKTKWDDLFAGELVTDQYIISGTSENYIEIEYYLKSNGNEGVFEIKIIKCLADESGGAYTAMEQGVKGKYNNCQTLSEYHTIRVQIINNEEDDTFITQKKGDMPMWVWYPIIGVALAIPLLAYLIWRFYNAKKRADVMEEQRKFELGEQEKQDDVGEFGVIGDHIEANPMATGNAFEVNKGDDIINHQLQIEKMNFETAKVEVEHNIFKQDFGPVQAEKHGD